MQNICKSFGGPLVLNNVNFEVDKGEIHALLGENGAGKSTLMNILGGVVHANSGEILIDGCPVKISSPSDAQKYGIAFVHQELNVVNDLKVYENLFLGREILKRGILDINSMRKATWEVLDKMNVKLSPDAMVKDLDTSYKQVVEIAKALLQNARIIIFDEPTTSLSNTEIENLFNIMRTLKEQNVSMIFISHKLKEVIEICDTYTILRDGVVVANGKISDSKGKITIDELARHMVGKEMYAHTIYREREIGKPLLEVNQLSLDGVFKDLSFTINKGEIVGFTGLLGDGRSEMAQCLFGYNKHYTGSINFKGKNIVVRSTEDALKCGIGYVPRNRKENGIIKHLTIKENFSIVTLKKFIKGIFINGKREKDACCAMLKQLNTKFGSIDDPIISLSGGNQQKVVLSKWLETNPDLLILDNPTQGVDVGAKDDIYTIIMDLATKGITIMLLSNEPQEIMRVCDRAYVMYHGSIQGELSRSEMTEENFMVLATGGTLQ
ncbi:MAG TPA: sugar ABC transporter ATP-binding protein [Clostridiaceae bacterium]|nr:sugar ABC transporter ATP-binding protein [Clostridiaceae bacterium]